jgi:tRNA-Thr(GGU) m(6)t(6)A37 methyltransferase TsaA
MDILLHPIGIIRSPYQHTSETPKWGTEAGDTEAEIILDEKYLEGIADIQPGERYQLVFYFHKSVGSKLTVLKRGTGALTGVFSTRSPNRPNPVGISVVTVTAVNGNRIRFTGVDMLDETPLIDIKSYHMEH